MAKKSWDQTLDNMYDTVHSSDISEAAPMLDPVAYRSDYRPEDIKAEFRGDSNIPWVWPLNANENYQEYWDDSNPAWQGQKWGLNPKYEWEGVMNTELEYDPTITTGWLNPNYLFWDAARQQNAKESWYIARRNDMIASALYNEWKVSREDVANYLSAQKWWFNSTESDRLNTIESVWKRLWQYAPQEEWKQYDESKADEIVKDNSWELYGKNTADEWNPKKWIQTLSDDNSVFTMMEEARANNLKALIANSPLDIATALDAWALPWTLQSIRDLQQYYPEYWEEVQQYRKKNKTQNEVNAITNWTQSDTENNGQSVINNANADFANNNAGSVKTSQEITKDVNDSLAKNQTANEASETMASIEEDMAILKNRLKNLKLEASQAFKWDVPDYLVNAYIANKSQEIQNQMQILEDRYNMAFSRYKTEVANTQWEKEFELKKEELALKEKYYNLEKRQAEQWTSTSKKTPWESTVTDDNGNQIAIKNDEDLAAAVDYLLEQFDYWKLGNGQCAAGIQKYYFPLIWISIWNLSSFDRKKSLINEKKGYTPKKWDLIILSSKSSPENWHIWIVIWVEWWYVQYLDWNGSLGKDWKWTEKAAINSMPIDSAKIQWYRNVNKWQDWIYNRTTNSDTNRNWTETDYSQFEKFLEATSDSARKSIASWYWYGDDLEWFTDLVRDALENRNKGTDTDNKDRTREWDDSDYSAFEQFRDKDTSKSDKEAIAEQYWFKDNLNWMNDFVREQLKNRNKDWGKKTNKWDDWTVTVTNDDWTTTTYAPWVTADDARLKERWFDPELWFNKYLTDVYDKILNWQDTWNWLENRVWFHERTNEQLANEAYAYEDAKKNWKFQKFDYSNRNVDKNYGFVLDAKDVYEAMAKAWGKIEWAKWDIMLQRLWLDPKDKNAWTIAQQEMNRYVQWHNDVEIDDTTQNLLYALEYIIMQDSSALQRKHMMQEEYDEHWQKWYSSNLSTSPEARTWRDKYEYIVETLALQALVDIKNEWATFWALSDNEWKRIAAAASLINWWDDKESFHDAIANTYYELRKSIWQEISKEEIEKMWDAESSEDFTNYLTRDYKVITWPYGLWQTKKKGTKWEWFKKYDEVDIPDEEEKKMEDIKKSATDYMWGWAWSPSSTWDAITDPDSLGAL